MGNVDMNRNKISPKNIKKRSKALNADRENKLANIFDHMSIKDTPFVKGTNFGENKKSSMEDFIFFHSTVEGRFFIKFPIEIY